MPDLFLSYARGDQEVARRFAQNFEREGFGVWWDQALNPGEAFDQVTEEALARASAVVVLWSKTSVNSRWVRAEATQANASNRLLPVMIEPCTRPIMFELTHTADLSQWKGDRSDPAWEAFVASVRRFVQRREQGTASVPVVIDAIPVPPPTLRQRAAGMGAALRVIALQAGRLLRRFGGRLAFAVAGAAIAVLIAWQLRVPPTHDITRFSIAVPGSLAGGGGLLLSPDGRRIVYGLGGQLFSRRLDQEDSTPIPGASGVTGSFFSPDGRTVAFFTSDNASFRLQAFDFGGEATRVLADIKPAPGLLGAWDAQGRIFFGQGGPYGISQVAAVGGIPEAFAPLGDYRDLDYPNVLPGGKWVLFSGLLGDDAQRSWNNSDTVAQNVATGERKVVIKGGHFARYLPTGHLVFVRGNTLYAVAFDPERLEVRGREVPVVPSIATNEGSGVAAFDVAENGTLLYVPGPQPGSAGNTVKSVVRVNRSGVPAGLSAEARDYSTPRASPDEARIAVEVVGDDKRVHIWTMDAKTGAATQLTFDGEEDRYPVWTADGRDVIYTSRSGKDYALWRKAADGTGEARKILDGTDALVATDVRGRTLIYQDVGATGMQRDLFAFDLDAGGPPRQLLTTPTDEAGGRVSPDGAWIAYVSTPAGGSSAARRVYVRPFPDTSSGGQRAISEGQGAAPAWAPAGDEIYYSVNAAQITLMAVSIAVTPNTITPTGRRALFELGGRFVFNRTGTSLGYGSIYEVMPRSGGFLAITAVDTARSAGGVTGDPNELRMNVVLNWFEELKRLVPTQ